MSKLLIVSCVLLLAAAACADQLLYTIDNFAGSTTKYILPVDATGWANLKVVGTGDRGSPNYKAFYWDPSLGSTPRQMLNVASSGQYGIATGISDDGSVVVGTVATTATNSSSGQAVRFYTNGTSYATRLDALTGTQKQTVASISADGTKAVGYNGKTTLACYWTIGTSGENDYTGHVRAYNTSNNGTYVSGRDASVSTGWVNRNGTFYTVQDTGDAGLQDVRVVSDDGVYAVGVEAVSSGVNKGVVWKWNGSAYNVDTILPSMDGYTGDKYWNIGVGQNNSISADGQWIVGVVTHSDSTTSPFIYKYGWSAVQSLYSFLSPAALALIPAGYTFNDISGISNDGTTIMGGLIGTAGDKIGFVAMVPEPATVALLGLGGLALIRRKK